MPSLNLSNSLLSCNVHLALHFTTQSPCTVYVHFLSVFLSWALVWLAVALEINRQKAINETWSFTAGTFQMAGTVHKKTSNIKLTTIKTEEKNFNKAVIYLVGKQTQGCPLQATRLKFIFPQYKIIGGWRHFNITVFPNSEYRSIVIVVLVIKPELY